MTDLPDIMPVEMDDPWPCRHVGGEGCEGCFERGTEECPNYKEEHMKTDEAVEEQQVDTVTLDEQDAAPSEQGQEQPTVTRVIQTPMSDEQKLSVGTELAELLAIIDELEDDKKASNKRYNDNISVKQGDAHKLAEKFLAGVNTEERECPIEYLWDTGEKKVKHPDTGEVIFEDSISDAERQKFMPGFDNQVDTVLPCVNKDCGEAKDGHCTDSLKDTSCADHMAPEPVETEGELMPCGNGGCPDELEGKCTDPEGDISCKKHMTPETESIETTDDPASD